MFTHLHVHTEYSLFDGFSRIPQLVQQAASLGMQSLAITDHGSLYGAVDFYSAALDAGVKPIIGCEIYAAKSNRFQKDPSEKSPFHLTLLAQDNAGYKNLIQLVTKAHLEGFYYRPRIDDELLSEHSQGLIVLSGCPSAQIPRLIGEGRIEEAESRARWYKELFQDRFFLEIQEHAHVPNLPTINKGLLALGHALELPLVATNDSHYTQQNEASLQDIRMCISTNSTIHDKNRLRMEDDSFYLKTPQEMADLFREIPEAISNTQRIAEMCQTTLNFGELHVPNYPVPDGENADKFLAKLCWEGLARIYRKLPPDAEARLQYELEVIKQTRFANYFLVVWEISSFVRRNQILLSVRGSAAASLALYCLGVTEIDCLVHDLVFERFLNVERKEMPDIDMDFQDDRRDEVLNYVTHRFGKDRVAQIITFGTLGPKAAIRDVGRALGMSYADTDRITRLLPFKVRTLNEALGSISELKEMYDTDEAIRTLLDNAQGLEGIPHHVSTHAAGVVISEDPLTEYLPLQRPARGDENSEIAMTQYAMAPIAKLGLLKMDFLGLTNLTILDKTPRLIEKTTGQKVDLRQIPLDDKKTFQLLSSGQTNEVFQLESSGMQRNIKMLKPSSLSDVAAMIALYRPGPMDQIPTFIDAKHGRKPVRSPHPSLDGILRGTYGVIVFQDQVLLILQTFAGYSLGEADIVRKAMGKKIPELMRHERERFLEGAGEKGFGIDLATEVFDLIEPFAGYAFNKAHSVSYALIAYWTAYFKANYPLEYMTSVLNARKDQPEKMTNAVHECLRMGIHVLLPDVNSSEVDFNIESMPEAKPEVRFGLAAVKNLGQSAVTPIVQARHKSGAFKSLDDFSRRADLTGLNRRALESLVKAGAFDSLGKRGSMLKAVESILAQSQREAHMRQTGQTSLFQLHANNSEIPSVALEIENEDASVQEKIAWERELLGVPLSSNNRFDSLNTATPAQAIVSRDELTPELEGQRITVLGQLSSTLQRSTQDNRPYISASLELLGGTLEVIVWPQILERTKEIWREASLLVVTGKMVVRNNEISVYCSDVHEHENSIQHTIPVKNAEPKVTAPNETTKTIRGKEDPSNVLLITLQETGHQVSDTSLLQDLVEVVLGYPGQDRVHLNIRTNGRLVRLDMPIGVKSCPELYARLDDLLGPGNVIAEASSNGHSNPTRD